MGERHVDGVAEALHLPEPATIERLDLPCNRVGGQNRYLRSEVERHLRGTGGEAAENVIQLRPEVIA